MDMVEETSDNYGPTWESRDKLWTRDSTLVAWWQFLVATGMQSPLRPVPLSFIGSECQHCLLWEIVDLWVMWGLHTHQRSLYVVLLSNYILWGSFVSVLDVNFSQETFHSCGLFLHFRGIVHKTEHFFFFVVLLFLPSINSVSASLQFLM